MKIEKGHIYRRDTGEEYDSGEEYVAVIPPDADCQWGSFYRLTRYHDTFDFTGNGWVPTGEKVDLVTCIGGTTVVVYKGELYTGCTRHSAEEADALLAAVGKALGWEIEQ